jgi:hypothetical protein
VQYTLARRLYCQDFNGRQKIGAVRLNEPARISGLVTYMLMLFEGARSAAGAMNMTSSVNVVCWARSAAGTINVTSFVHVVFWDRSVAGTIHRTSFVHAVSRARSAAGTITLTSLAHAVCRPARSAAGAMTMYSFVQAVCRAIAGLVVTYMPLLFEGIGQRPER